MASINKDIKENALYSFSPRVLKILLKDKTTRKNIVWATDDYASHGPGFTFNDQIQPSDIEGLTSIIKPRVEKSKEEQQKRIRGKAEVFTPSWICNKQNNLVDNAWFRRENVFNVETDCGWKTIYDKIEFPEETNFVEKGCDGFKWEIEVDDKKYEGYMCYPDFYKEVVILQSQS